MNETTLKFWNHHYIWSIEQIVRFLFFTHSFTLLTII